MAKKWLKALGLYEDGKSVHAMRHSYAVHYYRKTKDLLGLQKQLGHSTVKSTEIYAGVLADDIQENIQDCGGKDMAEKKKDYVNIGIRFPHELQERLQKLAFDERRSINKFVLEQVERYRDEREKSAPGKKKPGR